MLASNRKMQKLVWIKEVIRLVNTLKDQVHHRVKPPEPKHAGLICINQVNTRFGGLKQAQLLSHKLYRPHNRGSFWSGPLRGVIFPPGFTVLHQLFTYCFIPPVKVAPGQISFLNTPPSFSDQPFLNRVTGGDCIWHSEDGGNDTDMVCNTASLAKKILISPVTYCFCDLPQYQCNEAKTYCEMTETRVVQYSFTTWVIHKNILWN